MLKLYTINSGGIVMIVMIVSAKVIYLSNEWKSRYAYAPRDSRSRNPAAYAAAYASAYAAAYASAYAFVTSAAELQAPAGSSILADVALSLCI